MDFAVDLASSSTLHIHPSGALTFCGAGDEPDRCGDDDPLFAVMA